MNELNETLKVIRTQKAKLNTELKNETNRKKMMELKNNISMLADEETKCLKQLGEY